MKKKIYAEEITQRLLLIKEEVIASGACRNKTEFAKAIGEYQQNLSKMETGARAATVDQLATACELYGYSANWLILNIGPKNLDPQSAKPLEQRVSELEQQMQKVKNQIAIQLQKK